MWGGKAWDGDLIVFVGPVIRHLTDLVLPGEGIFESFFARRGDIDLTADPEERGECLQTSFVLAYFCSVEPLKTLEYQRIRK